MEALQVYAGFILLSDGVLLLFGDLPDNVPLSPVVYEAYPGNVRGIRVGPLRATVPSQVFKYLLEKPRLYLGTVNRNGSTLAGGVLFTVENLDTDAIFEVL